MVGIGPFGTLEVVGLLVAVIGLVPVLSQYREETRWFTAGYVLLVVGMIATNLEAVILGDVLNLVEHGVGIGVAGLTFFLAAYFRRENRIKTKG